MSENTYRFFSDATRVPIAARQSVHFMSVIAGSLELIRGEGSIKERPETAVVASFKWYPSAAHGDVECMAHTGESDRGLQVLDLKAAGALSSFAVTCAMFLASATTMAAHSSMVCAL